MVSNPRPSAYALEIEEDQRKLRKISANEVEYQNRLAEARFMFRETKNYTFGQSLKWVLVKYGTKGAKVDD